MHLPRVLIPLTILAGLGALVAAAVRAPVSPSAEPVPPRQAEELASAVEQVDRFFELRWQAEGVVPAEPADDLQVLRRLSLALHGSIPSLEEIRLFEADDRPERLERWTARMLADARFPDYFAERLARSFVGTEVGQFVVFRRDRFTNWLSDQLREGRPYDEIVRQIVSEQGLWTGRPAANFITAAAVDGDLDENKLAGRAVRAFLGQRIDCAQCHDHPFDDWKQPDFEGLAAFFGQAKLSVVGVEDRHDRQYEIEDAETLEKRAVETRVPFHPEWLPAEGTHRQRLAAWLTHAENRRFERAIANRVWGLLFGKPWSEPVDDLPDPPEGDPDLLDMLGADFREHGYDLRRLIHLIAASRPFRLSSVHDATDADEVQRLERRWGVFPLTRLRPEQVIGSMLQAANIRTIDLNSHLFVRAARFFREKDFVKEYGELGDNELEDRSGTIPQALLRMNGNLAQEILKIGPFGSSGRISAMAPNAPTCLETCYLVCLTRRPGAEECDHFLPQFETDRDDQRRQAVEDIYWALFNSPEFSWNH